MKKASETPETACAAHQNNINYLLRQPANFHACLLLTGGHKERPGGNSEDKKNCAMFQEQEKEEKRSNMALS